MINLKRYLILKCKIIIQQEKVKQIFLTIQNQGRDLNYHDILEILRFHDLVACPTTLKQTNRMVAKKKNKEVDHIKKRKTKLRRSRISIEVISRLLHGYLISMKIEFIIMVKKK